MEQDPRGGVNDDESEEGVDLEHLRELASFVVNAARRRPKLTTLTFVAIAALGLTLAAALPRMYSAQVKLLAQRSSALHLLTSPVQGMDTVDNPINNVAPMIMRRDNLLALAKEVNLVDRVEKTRSPILKLRDRVLGALHNPASEDERQLGLVRTLEKRLEVTTDDPTYTVTIAVDWSDPQLAYDLVTHVSKNFLEARYDSDVAMITDSIAVLEEHAKAELDHVDAELDAYQKVLASHVAKTGEGSRTALHVDARSFPALRSASIPSLPAFQADPLKTRELEETRVRIRALEEAQERTRETLKQQLVQAQTTLTPMHPTVIALQQQVDATNQPPEELIDLRRHERELMEQLVPPAPLPAPQRPVAAPLGAVVDAGSEALTAARGVETGAATDGLALPQALEDRDGPLQLAQSRLESAIHAYEDAVGRVDAAKIELDVTRAAYKHKYTVVTPAELPKQPKKATAQLITVASIVGAAIISLLLAVALEVVTGRILQPWQIRRKLRLDVLGELDIPS